VLRVCGRLLARLRVFGAIEGGGGALAGDTSCICFALCSAGAGFLAYRRYRGTRQYLYRHQRGDAGELGHSHLRLGLCLPALFLQQRVVGRAARRVWWYMQVGIEAPDQGRGWWCEGGV
jgi:hypothetical protein